MTKIVIAQGRVEVELGEKTLDSASHSTRLDEFMEKHFPREVILGICDGGKVAAGSYEELLDRYRASMEEVSRLQRELYGERQTRARAQEERSALTVENSRLRTAAALLENEHRELLEKQNELEKNHKRLWQRFHHLGDALRWALGEFEEFPARQPGQDEYYWRQELRRRATWVTLQAGSGEGETPPAAGARQAEPHAQPDEAVHLCDTCAECDPPMCLAGQMVSHEFKEGRIISCDCYRPAAARAAAAETQKGQT